jgi:hypothetical protein
MDSITTERRKRAELLRRVLDDPDLRKHMPEKDKRHFEREYARLIRKLER